MHMADALITPAVGGSMWAATAATTAWCSKKMREEGNDRKVPLMGVLGAFIFAAQMVNFTIPAAGSSGHLGGGLMLAVLLGPHAGFIVMASVLAVQALFFADGGLLSLGCNVFNLGFIPCFIGYPLVYRVVAGRAPTVRRMAIASMVGAVVGLQLGAFGVVAETTLSGVSELPFSAFLLLMQPIHLVIGLVEGAATAAVVSFVAREEPHLINGAAPGAVAKPPARKLLAAFALLALLLGGVFSWFASANPDGLEWAIAKVAGSDEIGGRTSPLHEALAALQKRTALLPDYDFAKKASPETHPATEGGGGTGLAGVIGSLGVLAVVALAGYLFRAKKR